MNEYRGFKIGDKVEVLNENKTTMITGTIEKFGDRKLGGCMEPDTMKVDIKESVNGSIYQLDMIHLVSHELIKKLPKYAAGDVVRMQNGRVCEVECMLGELYKLCGENGRYTESYLRPFNGFRVGDTVWTAKRGKGKIIMPNDRFSNRPFFVRFENDCCDRTPRLYNLFPTQKKMLESLPKMECLSYSWGFSMEPDNSVTPCGLKFETVFRTDINPKFNVGDAVFYEGEKWGIIGFRIEDGVRYTIQRGLDIKYAIKESDLRLWKETKFTHIIGSGLNNEVVPVVKDACWLSPKFYTSTTYLGKIFNGMDAFHCAGIDGCTIMMLGEKGDDI